MVSTRQNPRVERITTIGVGLGRVSDHPWSYHPIALAFRYDVGPVGTALAGYLPGRKLLLGADLPAAVYWQWRKWCTRRDFFQDRMDEVTRTIIAAPVRTPGDLVVRAAIAVRQHEIRNPSCTADHVLAAVVRGVLDLAGLKFDVEGRLAD